MAHASARRRSTHPKSEGWRCLSPLEVSTSNSSLSLSLSYMTDASDFFKACAPTWTWRSLQSLTLTSRLLHYIRSSEEACHLLRSAGATALQMRKLRDLAIWNGAKDMPVHSSTTGRIVAHTSLGVARGIWTLALRLWIPGKWSPPSCIRLD